jgi:hypothetical protein
LAARPKIGEQASARLIFLPQTFRKFSNRPDDQVEERCLLNYSKQGRVIETKRSQVATAIPNAREKVMLFLHGLCMIDLQWGRNGRNPGTLLAGELGWTPVHLHYNTGLHESTNGRAHAVRA